MSHQSAGDYKGHERGAACPFLGRGIGGEEVWEEGEGEEAEGSGNGLRAHHGVPRRGRSFKAP